MEYKYQVTVGMPVWGVEKYIKRCLLSILEQDFEDMEVLVVDDCSPDQSIAITKEIIDRHHGKIQVESTKDRTTFVIMLPIGQNKKNL